MDSGFVGSTTAGYSTALPRLDFDQLRMFRTISELKDGPIPAVLDTSCIRTGLHYLLVNGRLPTSVDVVRSGPTRMFMELDTLHPIISNCYTPDDPKGDLFGRGTASGLNPGSRAVVPRAVTPCP